MPHHITYTWSVCILNAHVCLR